MQGDTGCQHTLFASRLSVLLWFFLVVGGKRSCPSLISEMT